LKESEEVAVYGVYDFGRSKSLRCGAGSGS